MVSIDEDCLDDHDRRLTNAFLRSGHDLSGSFLHVSDHVQRTEKERAGEGRAILAW